MSWVVVWMYPARVISVGGSDVRVGRDEDAWMRCGPAMVCLGSMCVIELLPPEVGGTRDG